MKIMILILGAIAFNYSHADQIIDGIDEDLKKYEACSGEYFNQQDLNDFKELFEDLKAQGSATPVEVTDYGVHAITIINKQTKKECTLMIDGYEGRCVYAVCN